MNAIHTRFAIAETGRTRSDRPNPTRSAFDFSENDLPEPPDNFDVWNTFPEEFRDKVTNQFTNGIDHEYDLIRDRVAAEYATARVRQNERTARRNAPRGRR
jgi:hypothetical protein